jgi:putative ABC transport system permease protein
MFFVTYLRRELTRRARQAIIIALGLALGVGLVVTVSAASAGVARAESRVLGALYGVGTDVTVTGAARGVGQSPGEAPPPGAQHTEIPSDGTSSALGSPYSAKVAEAARLPGVAEAPPPGAQGTEVAPGGSSSALGSPYSGISASKVAEAARLRGVAAAAGGITLLESSITFPKNGPSTGQTSGYTIDGVDTADASLGPLGSASLVSGHVFTAAESDSDVAVLDSVYAKSHGLTAGSAVTVDRARYTVIGIVSQPQGSSPPAIYVPLARVQAMSLGGESLKNEVTTIYLAAASAGDIPVVSKEVTRLLPGTFVTTASSLAGQVTGSLTSAVKLVDDLDGWLTVLVLAAAFAVASLLMLAAVSRRVREFGILKAIGWRSRRIVGQVLGESAVIGVAGAAAGVGLGFAGAAIIAAVAPTVSATAGADNYPQLPGAHPILIGGSSLIHMVPVPLHPSVSADVIVLAVALALAGGLLAGVFASWRIAVLRPAHALARVA